MGRGASTADEFAFARRATELTAEGSGSCDAMQFMEPASASILAAREAGSVEISSLADATMETLDAVSMLDLAAKHHMAKALDTAADKSRTALGMLAALPPRRQGIQDLLAGVATQVDAIATILRDAPNDELPNVTSIQSALVAPVQELERLDASSLTLDEWEQSRSTVDEDAPALRHLVEAAGHTVAAAATCGRYLMRDISYFVIPVSS
jgi:hypothetical protein